MASIKDIRVALAAKLSASPDLQVSAYILASPTPPYAHVFPAEVEYDRAMVRGLDELTFTVEVAVPLTSDQASQQLLDEYLAGSGDRSVKQKLEVDRTLGGVVQNLRVTGSSGYMQVVREGAGPVLAAQWQVEVLATGG
jgi:hypothetical protein